mgnify:CR=1 FL=1
MAYSGGILFADAMDFDRVFDVLRAFDREKVRCVLIGGVALNIHGLARATQDLESQEHIVEGVRVQVATPKTLYRMKKNTVRPIDRADADALDRRFGLGGK